MRRLFWRLAYPFARIAYKLGASYKWVNICKSAWMTPDRGYGPLWHYQHFGTPINQMPEEVNLRGVTFRVTIPEKGVVLFAATDKVGQIKFERATFIWFVNTYGLVSANALTEAYKWIEAVFGGSFEHKSDPIGNE